MRTMNTLAAVLLTAVLPVVDSAVDMKPMHAYTFETAEQRAVVYYTEEANGQYEVVTTMARKDGSGSPMRYIVVLSEDEHHNWSLADTQRTVLEISCSGSLVSFEVSDSEQVVAALESQQ